MNGKFNKIKKKGQKVKAELFIVLSLVVFFVFLGYVMADPEGPDDVTVLSNETKSTVGQKEVNISGGRIATLNLTATTQNTRWKGFVGYMVGTFTLDDASGSTLYDWTLASVDGEVFATRNSSTVTWSNIKCANTTILENENVEMNHTNSQDNITATFDDTTHSAFTVAGNSISADSCPTLNTYVNNASQDTSFEEVALWDGINDTITANVVYSTILENDVTGFDNNAYDFQMVVPEIGLDTFTGSTAYYVYVELS